MNFGGGLLLHHDDTVLNQVEVEVRIDGPLASVVNDELKLTFEKDEGVTVIEVYLYDEEEDDWAVNPISSPHTWPIDASFEPFRIRVDGIASGHTELVLTVDPEPESDRPIADRVFIIINE